MSLIVNTVIEMDDKAGAEERWTANGIEYTQTASLVKDSSEEIR